MKRLYLSGDLEDKDGARLVEGILEHEDVEIVLAGTTGGCGRTAAAVVGAMRLVPRPIHALAIGHVGSASALLFSGATGRRRISRHAQLFHHEAELSTAGKTSGLTRSAEAFVAEVTHDAALVADRCGLTIAQLTAERWYTAAEAVEAGLADEIVEDGAL